MSNDNALQAKSCEIPICFLFTCVVLAFGYIKRIPKNILEKHLHMVY